MTVIRHRRFEDCMVTSALLYQAEESSDSQNENE